MVLEEGEPMVGNLHVGVALSVHPRGVLGFGKVDVGCFAQGMLAGIDSSYLDVEGWGTITGTDDDGLSSEFSEGFEDGATELLQGGDVLHGDGVVYAVSLSY